MSDDDLSELVGVVEAIDASVESVRVLGDDDLAEARDRLDKKHRTLREADDPNPLEVLRVTKRLNGVEDEAMRRGLSPEDSR